MDLLYEKAIGDPQPRPCFEEVDVGHLKGHQREFIGAAHGVPETHQSRDISAAHAGLGVTDADFDGVVGHLVATFSELGIAEVTIDQIGHALAPLRSAPTSSRNPRSPHPPTVAGSDKPNDDDWKGSGRLAPVVSG